MTDIAAPIARDPRPAAPVTPRRRSGWRLVRGAWAILVGIKDALVLIAILLFFGLLFAALNARSSARTIRDGALILNLDGPIVEQPVTPGIGATLTGQVTTRQYRLRDVIRAIDAARSDGRVKALVLDLDKFGGAYPAALGEVGDALRRFRDTKKPILAYATAYTDGSYELAANASEVWVNPFGGTLFTGPGGSQLYYKGLIDKLGVDVHVYRVGKFKSFVEPYVRADQSPAAREAAQALYGGLFEQWRQVVERARPQAKVAQFVGSPAQAIMAANGDIATANLRAGLVDKLGDRTDFGRRVAQIVGGDPDKPIGSYKGIQFDDWLDANPLPTKGDAIGVLTVAGEIVDGEGETGSAAGDTIEKALLDGLADNKLKALVVRVDSPGGSVLASEQIRKAVLIAKQKKLPVIVSMGGLAASGGYWVSTAADMIFAEPSTITGSIGIFGVLPTFQNTLAKIGITTDGVRTTPLSGQPDVLAGTTPMLDAILQAGIENGYREFIGRVAAARRMTPAHVDQIAQGRVWIGGTARQIGLVDRFGNLSDAMAEAARRAKLDPGNVHAVYLEKEPNWAAKLARSIARRDDEDTATPSGDIFTQVANRQRLTVALALGDMKRLASAGSIQARCLECSGLGPGVSGDGDARLLDLVIARLGL